MRWRWKVSASSNLVVKFSLSYEDVCVTTCIRSCQFIIHPCRLAYVIIHRLFQFPTRPLVVYCCRSLLLSILRSCRLLSRGPMVSGLWGNGLLQPSEMFDELWYLGTALTARLLYLPRLVSSTLFELSKWIWGLVWN